MFEGDKEFEQKIILWGVSDHLVFHYKLCLCFNIKLYCMITVDFTLTIVK